MRDERRDDGPWAAWQGRIAAARKRRDDRVAEWQQNVARRRGDRGRATDPTTVQTTAKRILVNQDAPLTKAKIAQLYSQTPQVRLEPRDEALRPAVLAFAAELNDTIATAAVGSTIEEVLADVVNASGIGGVLVSCEQRTEPREVPTVDPAMLSPEDQAAVQAGTLQLPTETVETPTDIQYLATRISPADLLIPTDFTGSHYDHARWLGHEGRMTWAQAQRDLGLTDDQKDQVLGTDKRSTGITNTLLTPEGAMYQDRDVVTFTQVFAWRYFDDPAETSFKALQRIVFVEGLTEPVIDEPYVGQQRTEDGRIVGVDLNPIQICTLTYISDESLPPSDSSLGRTAVDELQQSRDDMSLQRRHSIPFRWGDSNRISPNMRARIDKGDFQGFIWTNGPGDRAIGDVARASFPNERWEFDKVIKNDLTEIWQVGSNQAGAFASGERSAREASIVERNFQRRVGQEQDKVTAFFLRIAKVLAGHLAIFGRFDVPDAVGPQRAALANAFTYTVRADATVRLEADQRIEQLTRALNLTAQSGYVNPKAVIAEIWELSGMDPAKVMQDPQPKPPEPVKVSVSNAMDLHDPLFLALLMRTQQGPTPQDLAAAVKLEQAVSVVGPPPVTPQPETETDIQRPAIAHSGWDAAPRLDRRQEDGGA